MEQNNTGQEEKQQKISRILNDIKDAERKADAIIDKAVKEKEKILNEAHSKASTLLIGEEQKVQQQQDKKISDHKDKLKALKARKAEEGRKLASEAEYKANKNIGKATDYIIEKIDEKVD